MEVSAGKRQQGGLARRLATFKCWPHTFIPNPLHLAKSGFVLIQSPLAHWQGEEDSIFGCSARMREENEASQGIACESNEE
jgi:hypothetical protein